MPLGDLLEAEPTKIERTLHIIEKGLEVEVDDDSLRELSKFQDMILEVPQGEISEARREGETAIELPIDADATPTDCSSRASVEPQTLSLVLDAQCCLRSVDSNLLMMEPFSYAFLCLANFNKSPSRCLLSDGQANLTTYSYAVDSILLPR